MVKLTNIPRRGRRASDRLDDPPEADPFPDYSTTLASGLDDTVRNLRVMRDSERESEESVRLRYDALQQTAIELETIRKEQAKLIETLKLKCSKRAFKEWAEVQALLNAKIDKRMDNVFKLIAVFGSLIAILISVKGK